jgi:hypothetical protein
VVQVVVQEVVPVELEQVVEERQHRPIKDTMDMVTQAARPTAAAEVLAVQEDHITLQQTALMAV